LAIDFEPNLIAIVIAIEHLYSIIQIAGQSRFDFFAGPYEFKCYLA